jgi:hypothetical protein
LTSLDMKLNKGATEENGDNKVDAGIIQQIESSTAPAFVPLAPGEKVAEEASR